MKFLRLHWFDLGMAMAAMTGLFILETHPGGLTLLLWVNLIALFLHQFEEYRYPGNFPGMMNKVMFSSSQPDRYPLNSNSALIINLLVGWLSFFLAVLFGERAPWLAIAVILVSAGNFIAHTFLFNIKGKSRYNPGMLTADILFLPIVVYFFFIVIQGRLATSLDWILGFILGVVLNYLGILKLIDLLKDKNTHYIFLERFMVPQTKKRRL
jgi:hypothetical protein